MIKRKYFILFFCVCTHINNLFSQTVPCTDTINISGYYVVIDTKKEINQIIYNNKRKKQGKPYTVTFFLTGINNFFIPFDSIDKKEQISDCFDNLMNSNLTDFYTSYSNISDFDYKKNYDTNCLDYLRYANLPDFPYFGNFDYYVTTNKKSKYCFKMYSLSAKWIRIKLPSLKAAYDMIGRKGHFLRREENEYNIYILAEILALDLTPNIDNLPIKLWVSI
jgi:hypothetical protein